jgi:hypothetical protein
MPPRAKSTYIYIQLCILPGIKIIIKSRNVIYLFIYLNSYCPKRVLGLLPDKKEREHLGAHGLDTQLKICHIINNLEPYL